MKILVFSCHPDDVEITCVGTLLKCVARGDEVTVCHVCNGNMGHVVIMPDELGPMRIAEAKRAGDMGGIKVRTLDRGDLVVYDNDRSIRDDMVDVLREEQPDLVITHNPVDYMPDHTAVSKCCFDAVFTASCLHYRPTAGLMPSQVTPLYYMDTLAGLGFTPTEYVDITDYIDKKLEMLECHESQIKWMRDHDHIDFPDFVRTTSKWRGYQCGCAYAEAFTSCSVYDKNRPVRLLP